MQPGKYDMKVIRGATFQVSFTASTKTVDINFSEAYAGARLQVWPAWAKKQEDFTGEPLMTLSTDAGGITMNGLMLSVKLTAEQTKGIQFDQGIYALELYTEGFDSVIDPFMEGAFDVGVEKIV